MNLNELKSLRESILTEAKEKAIITDEKKFLEFFSKEQLEETKNKIKEGYTKDEIIKDLVNEYDDTDNYGLYYEQALNKVFPKWRDTYGVYSHSELNDSDKEELIHNNDQVMQIIMSASNRDMSIEFADFIKKK